MMVPRSPGDKCCWHARRWLFLVLFWVITSETESRPYQGRQDWDHKKSSGEGLTNSGFALARVKIQCSQTSYLCSALGYFVRHYRTILNQA
jgi:hypothetical protein